MSDTNLITAITKAVAVLQVLPSAPDDHRKVIQAWLLVAKRAGLDPASVEEAMAMMLERCKFFPTPADFRETGLRARDRVIERRTRDRLRTSIEALDRDGNLVLCPPGEIDGDRYLPIPIDR